MRKADPVKKPFGFDPIKKPFSDFDYGYKTVLRTYPLGGSDGHILRAGTVGDFACRLADSFKGALVIVRLLDC